jgi:dipeptidase E
VYRHAAVLEGKAFMKLTALPSIEREVWAAAVQLDVANAEKWAARLPVPAYAIDDDTAVKVTDGSVEVVSAGHWKLFNA